MVTHCFGKELQIVPAPDRFVRPSAALLFQGIVEGISFSSRKNRHKAAELIKIMDSEHMKYLVITDVNIVSPDDFNSWIKKKSQRCHLLTPLSERVLIASLVLQIEILDINLGKTDNTLLKKLQKKRSTIRIKKKTDAFFGDSRDVFIGTILNLSEQIQDLQGALGVEGNTTWDFPMNAESFSAVQNYLIEKMMFLANRANKLKEQ